MREAYEAKLRRMSGMSEKRKAYVNAKLAMANDWNINCQVCGKRVFGLISELTEHAKVCDGKKSS